jgi:hypothetical protein
MSRSKRPSAADELQQHRNDPGEWAEESIPIEVKPSKSEVFSFRLSPEELDELEAIAQARGVKVSHLVREGLRMVLRGVENPSAPIKSVWVVSGATGGVLQSTFQLGPDTVQAGWSSAPWVEAVASPLEIEPELPLGA